MALVAVGECSPGRSMENSEEANPTIAMKEPGSAERGYRDSRRSLVEEGGAPEGVSSLSHFARQHVEPWRLDLYGGMS